MIYLGRMFAIFVIMRYTENATVYNNWRDCEKRMKKNYDYLIVGAGLYGSVFAYEMTKAGKKCLVIDKRSHVGGNIYTKEVEGIKEAGLFKGEAPFISPQGSRVKMEDGRELL